MLWHPTLEYHTNSNTRAPFKVLLTTGRDRAKNVNLSVVNCGMANLGKSSDSHVALGMSRVST